MKSIKIIRRFSLSFLLLQCIFLMLSSQEKVSYRTINDISYRNSGNDYALNRCKLDIYYPQNVKDFPTIVWFHGGGLTGGNKSIPTELKNCGYAVVSVNYRLMPKCLISDCIDDAAAAVAWTFSNIDKYGGNNKKIFVCGHSAGGYLTLMIGLDKKWLKYYSIDADSVAGLFPLSGQAISHFAYRETKGMKNTQPLIDEFAPLYYVRNCTPPMVLVTGDRELEMLGRYEENAYLWRMMQLVGHKQTYLYELDGFNHGAMSSPAFHIVKNHIKAILQGDK